MTPPVTDVELDKLAEESKNDRHIIVGSDIRLLVTEVRRLRERERDICKAVGGVSDGGQYRNDIIEHLKAVFSERDQLSRVLAIYRTSATGCFEAERDAANAHAEALAKALENIKKWALHYDRRQSGLPDGLGGYGEIADEAHDALMAYEKARGK